MIITASEVKGIAFTRVVADYLIPDSLIEVAQEKHIRPVLGDDLYDDVVDNPGDHTALLVYIKKALAWFVKFYCLPSIYVDLSTTGVKKVDTQGTSEGSEDNLGSLQQQALTAANSHIDSLKRYLKNNNYPLWVRPRGNNVEVIGGMVFDKHNYDYCCDRDE